MPVHGVYGTIGQKSVVFVSFILTLTTVIALCSL